MTSCSAIRLSGFFAILLVGLVFSPAELFASNPAPYVDCDGDGFDDNLPDQDADGIPDELEFHSFFTSGSFSIQTSTMFQAAFSSDAAAEPPPPAPDKGSFGRREFHARGICSSRSDFEADFSGSLGLGGGLGGGGGCAGGICF